jgi:hypothetical protein
MDEIMLRWPAHMWSLPSSDRWEDVDLEAIPLVGRCVVCEGLSALLRAKSATMPTFAWKRHGSKGMALLQARICIQLTDGEVPVAPALVPYFISLMPAVVCGSGSSLDVKDLCPWNLSSIFDALKPTKSCALPCFEVRKGPGQCSPLLSLPPEILVGTKDTGIAQYLQAFSLSSFAHCSTQMHAAVQQVIPGLVLRLYPHQVNGVNWMLACERRKKASQPHPYFEMLRTKAGRLCYISASGTISPDTPPQPEGCRGGMLCDEPGLGKTITGTLSPCSTSARRSHFPLFLSVLSAVQCLRSYCARTACSPLPEALGHQRQQSSAILKRCGLQDRLLTRGLI